jgi:hypothetical protein
MESKVEDSKAGVTAVGVKTGSGGLPAMGVAEDGQGHELDMPQTASGPPTPSDAGIEGRGANPGAGVPPKADMTNSTFAYLPVTY